MWARVDDAWWCHPKVLGIGAAARGVWISALSWSCHQRKPVIPRTLLPMLGGDESHAADLVAAGLWTVSDDGWEIHQWAEYQDLSTSEKRAIAGAKGGKKSGEARRSKPKQTDGLTSGNAETERSNAEANAEAGPSLPIPAPPSPSQNASAAHDNTPPTVVEPGPQIDVEQQVRRAIGIYARSVAASTPGVDDLGAYAHGVGLKVNDADRADLAERIAGGESAEDAAAWLGDPLRGLTPGAPAIDPAEAARVAEVAAKREAETADRLAEMRSRERAPMPEALSRRNRIAAVPDPDPSPHSTEAHV